MFDRSVPWYDAFYEWKDYAAEARALRACVARHGRSAGRRWLDVACGTGQHVRHRGKRDEVVGLDLSARMLRIARRRNPGVRFVRGDMTSFRLRDRFDVVTCLFSSIGYVKGVKELRAAFRRFADHLVPGGVMIVEPWLGPDDYLRGTVSARLMDLPDAKFCRMNLCAVRGRVSVMDMHHLVGTTRGVRHFVERHELTMFTRAELLAAARAAGLVASFEAKTLPRGAVIGVKPPAGARRPRRRQARSAAERRTAHRESKRST